RPDGVAEMRCDERLADVLEPLEQGMGSGGSLQRLLARLEGLENVDICAGDKGRSGADEDDRVRLGISSGAGDRLIDGLPNALRERVHRRIVDRQNGNAILNGVPHEIGPEVVSLVWSA